MEKISVYITAYNEEERLPYILQSVSMFDEIIVIDKSSTDNTKKIAKEFNAKVIKIPYKKNYTDNDMNYIFSVSKNEWILRLTGADIVHPLLYSKMLEIINRDNFRADKVYIPWVEWLFGYESEALPYCHYSRPVLQKKSMIQYSNVVHKENELNNSKLYRMKSDKKIAVHHMTFFNLKYSYKEQILRYGLLEAELYKGKYGTWKIMKDMISSAKSCIGKYFNADVKGKGKYFTPSLMIILYRAICYYLSIFSFVIAEKKNNRVISTFNQFVEELPDQGDYHKSSLKIVFRNFFITMLKSIIIPIIGLIEDFFVMIAMLVNFIFLFFVTLWDRNREISVELFYLDLKTKIISNKY